LEPFGESIADLRHGTACSLLANVNRNAEKTPTPYKPDDFIYWVKKPDQEIIEIDDPQAQSDLIRAELFGMHPKPEK